MKAYPNLSQDMLNVAYQTNDAQVIIKICDLVGRELFSQTAIGGTNIIQVPTAEWSNGSYIYKLNGWNATIGSGIFMISH